MNGAPMRFSAGWIGRGVIAATTGLVVGAGAIDPAPYHIVQATLDSGGGTASSGHYRLVASVGLPGGLARSETRRYEDRRGFIASLNDPPVPGADTLQRPLGRSSKVRVASLLANDGDPEGDRVLWRGFAAQSEAGGSVTHDQGWLVYDPPGSAPDWDQFTYTIEDEAGNRVTAWVTVLVRGPGLEPSRNFVEATVQPNGHVRVVFAGIAGRLYGIEWTDRLPAIRWDPLATVRADARGGIEWVDTTEPRPPQRYYRTVGQ